MNDTSKYVRQTIVWGIICGLMYVPGVYFALRFFSAEISIRLVLWLFISGYVVLLCRGARVNRGHVGIFLVMLFGSVFFISSFTGYILFGMLVFSFLRTGVCFTQNRLSGGLTEILLTFAAGVTIAKYCGDSLVSQAMGVWMFFLLQSIFFIVFPSENKKESPTADPFESAKKHMDEIFNGF